MTHAQPILDLLDAGHTPAQIALALALPAGTVYAVLRQERPDRTRSLRTRTSDVPAKAVALHQAGVPVGRVAVLLGVSRAYIYRCVAEQKSGT